MKSTTLKLSKKFAFIMGVSLISLGAGASFAQEVKQSTETVTVLGSRIKRINKEGPAPVTTIDAAAIQAGGYASIPEVLKSVTQNGGQTQSQQDFGGGIMTPGAAQVDLRGLGPNHSLVMMNGRRVADFPMPFNAVSNFVDVSNIPVSLVDKVEILSGSASAVYGSDAIAGVVNFTMKKSMDGSAAGLKYGFTEDGGGESLKATYATGYKNDKLSLVFGAEYLNNKPLWQYDRAIQDSTADSPTARRKRPQYVFIRYSDGDDNSGVAIDPGTAVCASLSSLDRGTIIHATDSFGDSYCGSRESIAFGTITSDKKAFNTFTGLTYDVNASTSFFADLQLGQTKTKLMNDVTKWSYQDAEGNKSTFWNSNSDLEEFWMRQFTPEEAGGFDKFMTTNDSYSYSFTPGIRSKFNNGWDLEASFNASSYVSEISLPEINAAKANAFFLGPQTGTDADGLPIYNANPSKLFRALTNAEYASIAENAVTKAKSWNKNLSVQLNKGEIFNLPAGPVGFAAIAEIGSQGYEVIPNPEATNFGHYVGFAATSGAGSRSHEAVGAEFKIPVFSSLDLSAASRWDAFQFGDTDISKTTYNLGLEYRPVKSLLVRGAYGTGFRAPDLHYVFAKLDLFHPTVTDYYNCRVIEGGDCDVYSEVDILKHREGSDKLKPETSKSLNAGFVWQPTRNFDISVDYYNIKLNDEVQDMSLDQVLRDEADCRIGQTASGTSVNTSSPTCLDVKSRVHRDVDGNITFVYINPINVAEQKTDGIDIEAHYVVPTSYGKYKFSLGHSEVWHHTSVQYAGDTEVNRLAVDSGYTIPKQKTNASIGFSKGPLDLTLTANRLGKIPNWNSDEWLKATYLYNANLTYDINKALQLSVTINNIANKGPQVDKTQRSYPYYNMSWYDSVGRSYYVELSYKF